MAKEVRLNMSENEKMAIQHGLNVTSFKGDSIEKLAEKEKTRKFNNELEQMQEKLEEKNNTLMEEQDKIGYDINKAAIKPMFSRVLIKPFKVNPFQKMKVEGGIIVDAGGYNPNVDYDPIKGKYQEMDQFIQTGCVIEIGPEVKYLKEGDVVYFRKDTILPVPFLNSGLYTINENQVIAAVNEGLEERFNSVK